MVSNNNTIWGLAAQDMETKFYKGHRVEADEAETADK